MSVLRRDFVGPDGEPLPVRAESLGQGRYRVRVGEEVLELMVWPMEDGALRLAVGGEAGGPGAVCRQHIAYAQADGERCMVRLDGRTWTLEQASSRRRGGAAHQSGEILAPMTGTVLAVECQAGETVEVGQTLVVLSAMKMEHKLNAGIAGTVKAVHAKAGATVEQGALLVEIEAPAGQ